MKYPICFNDGVLLVCFLKKFHLDLNTNQILRRGQNWIFQNIAKKIFEQHCLFLICGLLREISISIENLNVDQTKYVPPPTMNWNGNVFSKVLGKISISRKRLTNFQRPISETISISAHVFRI